MAKRASFVRGTGKWFAQLDMINGEERCTLDLVVDKATIGAWNAESTHCWIISVMPQ